MFDVTTKRPEALRLRIEEGKDVADALHHCTSIKASCVEPQRPKPKPKTALSSGASGLSCFGGLGSVAHPAPQDMGPISYQPCTSKPRTQRGEELGAWVV